MPIQIIGEKFVFGNQEPKRLVGFPTGKLRLRLRPKAFAIARVRTKDGIREFYIKEHDGCWIAGYERGRNVTAPNDTISATADMDASNTTETPPAVRCSDWLGIT